MTYYNTRSEYEVKVLAMGKKVTAFRTRRGQGDAALMETLDAFARPPLPVLGEDPSVIDIEAKRYVVGKAELLKAMKTPRASAWRNLGPELRVQYFQLALLNSEAWLPASSKPASSLLTVAAIPPSTLHVATAFTLNLGPAVERRALGWAKGPADYFRRRIARRLPYVPFYLACEFDENRLHLHGGISYSPQNEEGIRSGLKAIGGPYPSEFEERALRFVSIYDPVSWSTYACLELRQTAERLKSNPVATSHRVVREARRLHGLHRGMLVCGTSAP
jgi:hypothetical protein